MFSKQTYYQIDYQELEYLIKENIGSPKGWRIFDVMDDIHNDSYVTEDIYQPEEDDVEGIAYRQDRIEEFVSGDGYSCSLNILLAELQRRGILEKDATQVLIRISW